MRRSASLLTATVLAALPTAGILSPASLVTRAAASVQTFNGVTLNGFEARLVRDINSARRAHGLRGLTVTAGTTDVARRWSHHLATTQQLAHNPSLVTDVAHAGSSAWTDIAENVGCGPADAPDVLFAAYMASPPHRANILDPAERYLGVGVVQQGVEAWNTLDFTNAYSSRYGESRVRAAVMAIDGVASSAVRAASTDGLTPANGTVASHGRRQVLVTRARSVSGSGAATTLRATGDRGFGVLALRGPLHLGHSSSVRLRLAARGRDLSPVWVHVRLLRRLGGPVRLATVKVSSTTQSVVVSLPSSLRSRYAGFALVVTGRQVLRHGGWVRLTTYGARAGG